MAVLNLLACLIAAFLPWEFQEVTKRALGTVGDSKEEEFSSQKVGKSSFSAIARTNIESRRGRSALRM